MANLRDIRRRIKSIKNTAQITRAMQLVAASKMKKAQDQALAGRTYAEHLKAVLANLTDEAAASGHPLMRERDTENPRELVIVISTDKGLCGGLNTNLFRRVLREVPAESRLVTVGNKARNTFARLRRDIAADFQIKDPVAFSDTRNISRVAARMFLEGEVDVVRVAYTRFLSTLSQQPEIVRLLPLDTKLEDRESGLVAPKDATAAPAVSADTFAEYLFEPSRAEVFASMLPLYVNYLFYQMTMEARASEHSARMVAMKSATDNAKDLVKDLSLEYNKLRQAAITSELLEISTAQAALG